MTKVADPVEGAIRKRGNTAIANVLHVVDGLGLDVQDHKMLRQKLLKETNALVELCVNLLDVVTAPDVVPNQYYVDELVERSMSCG